MDDQEEIYVHLANCIDSMNRVWRILNNIRRNKDNPLAGYAFELALIEYSKPYKDSNSAFRNEKGKPIRKYRLGTEFVPKKYLELHRRILDTRDRFYAHLDLDIRDAKVYVQKTEYGKNIVRSQNLIDGIEKEKNIEDIVGLVEITLNAMHEKAKILGDKLPPNF